MDLNEYQDKALATATYPDVGSNLIYPTVKLNGEAGEVAEKVGKKLRACNLITLSGIQLGSQEHDALVKEVGDVLWYIAALAYELNVSLSYIAEQNLIKLQDRRERGVIIGEGDNR